MGETERIFVVFKTHFDIGFTELAEEVIRRYGTGMLADVVKTCEETQKLDEGHRFVWTMATWPLLKSLDPDTTPGDILSRAEALLKNGQLTWHALPYTTHTEFCGIEEFIRGIYFARGLDQKYGRRTIGAKMTDVPGHTWMLPEILSHAGIRFLHLGCNAACMPPDVPRLFWWEGPDGGRVLTFYSRGGYGTSLLPPKDWKYPVWLAMMQTNDNVGPQDSNVVEDMLKIAHDGCPDAEVTLGTLDAFYEALINYLGDEVPVIRADLADTWIHGVSTYPKEVGQLRALRGRLGSIEKLLTAIAQNGEIDGEAVSRTKSLIDRAYEYSLLFGEHTWGLDVKTVLGWKRVYDKKAFQGSRAWPEMVRIEKSWDEQRQRVRDVKAYLDEADALLLKEKDSVLTVFNGLSYARDAWVELSEYADRAESGVINARTGKAIPLSRTPQGLFGFLQDIPALGTCELRFQETPPEEPTPYIVCDAERGVLENRRIRVGLDKARGGIVSLIVKETGAEWVRQGEVLGQYRYDIYDNHDITDFIKRYSYRFFDWSVNDLGRMNYPECEHECFVPGDYEMTGAKGAHSASLVLTLEQDGRNVREYGDARGLEMAVTIYDDSDAVDITWTLRDKEETPFVESGHFLFPFAAGQPEYRFDKLGSVVNPAKDIAKDANNLLYLASSWVDVQDGGRGIAVLPKDAPLFSIGENAIYRYRGTYEQTDPALFCVAYSNSYGTNFPQWMGGTLSFRYRLIPHEGDWREANIPKLAMEWMQPPLTLYGAVRGLAKEPLVLSSDAVHLLAVKLSEDGRGYIVRIMDLSGKAHSETLTFPQGVRAAWLCDGQEYDVEPLALNASQASVRLSSFGLSTIRVIL